MKSRGWLCENLMRVPGPRAFVKLLFLARRGTEVAEPALALSRPAWCCHTCICFYSELQTKDSMQNLQAEEESLMFALTLPFIGLGREDKTQKGF